MASKALLLYRFKMVYSNIKLHQDMVNNTSGFGLHCSNIFGCISIVAFFTIKREKSGQWSGQTLVCH